MTTLQLLITAIGLVLILALYIGAICFITGGCSGDCNQGRGTCNCKRGPDA